jgi:hypothetical protein
VQRICLKNLNQTDPKSIIFIFYWPEIEDEGGTTMTLLPSMADGMAAKAGVAKSEHPSMEDSRAIKLQPTMADARAAKRSRDGRGRGSIWWCGGGGSIWRGGVNSFWCPPPHQHRGLRGQGIHEWRAGGRRASVGAALVPCLIGNQGGEHTIGAQGGFQKMSKPAGEEPWGEFFIKYMRTVGS